MQLGALEAPMAPRYRGADAEALPSVVCAFPIQATNLNDLILWAAAASSMDRLHTICQNPAHLELAANFGAVHRQTNHRRAQKVPD